ncbi:tetrapyrrole methylase [Phlyctochytrium arcticum]|nr:tetrapyrrole methylase [Phlyctochytrium arcticum]
MVQQFNPPRRTLSRASTGSWSSSTSANLSDVAATCSSSICSSATKTWDRSHTDQGSRGVSRDDVPGLCLRFTKRPKHIVIVGWNAETCAQTLMLRNGTSSFDHRNRISLFASAPLPADLLACVDAGDLEWIGRRATRTDVTGATLVVVCIPNSESESRNDLAVEEVRQWCEGNGPLIAVWGGGREEEGDVIVEWSRDMTSTSQTDTGRSSSQKIESAVATAFPSFPTSSTTSYGKEADHVPPSPPASPSPTLSSTASYVSESHSCSTENSTDVDNVANLLSYLPTALPPLPSNSPHLTLLGIGPGSPSHLTLLALHHIRSATLLILDTLTHPSIPGLAPHTPYRITNKRKGNAPQAQHEIHTWILDELRAGGRVVRVKAGDPLVYGRGGEEYNLFHHALGYPVTILPGLSSAFSAPTLAKVPLTHRGTASQILVATGRKASPDDRPQYPNYDPERTLVLLMAVSTLSDTTSTLIKQQQYPPSTPVCVIEKAGWGGGEQRIFRSTLNTVVDIVKREGVTCHATIIVGRVVGVLDQVDDMALQELHQLTGQIC